MGFSILYLLLSSFLLCSSLLKPADAVEKSYIVYLGAHSHGSNPSPFDLESATNSHYSLLASYLGSYKKAKEAIYYSYNRHINGFAAVLEEDEAEEIAKNPKVLSVFVNKGHELQTTGSWEFLGLESNGIVAKDSLWEKARYGEDVIIANIDTGVWPESESFSDEGMGPVPSKWCGICQLDNFRCNRKLIGARFFSKGHESIYGKLSSSLYTARDFEGHGTTTLSTAAGNFVPGASFLGFANGTAKGGSPKARAVVYKVCWGGANCSDADVIDAFEAAISDGVDVVSFSLGKFVPTEMFQDGFSIGAFHAAANGVIVVSGAGNGGPEPGSVTNVAPWMFTVGASTIDRDFANYLALGDKKILEGASLSMGLPSEKFYRLITGEEAKATNATSEDAKHCMEGSIDPKKAKGKILVCLLKELAGHIYAEQQALLAGAVAMILANNQQRGNDVFLQPHLLPTSLVNFTEGQYVYSYINRTKTPRAHMTRAKTQVGVKSAPVMASLSSRGPNVIQPTLLKPDVTAPGVDILAAYSEAISPSYLEEDNRRVPFSIGTGTSVACPHVSGIVGLLKTIHPDWSPAALKSAIMTTATTQDEDNRPILGKSKKEATPFSYGAGHIQPDLAMDPGLVYDLTTDEYLNFLCAHGYNQTQIMMLSKSPYNCPKSYCPTDFNYPSISVPNLGIHSVNVRRTVTIVGSADTYEVHVKAPEGVVVLVEPSSLTFEEEGEKKKFKVVLRAIEEGEPADYVFGELWWSDGKHKVRSPIVVKHQ